MALVRVQGWTGLAGCIYRASQYHRLDEADRTQGTGASPSVPQPADASVGFPESTLARPGDEIGDDSLSSTSWYGSESLRDPELHEVLQRWWEYLPKTCFNTLEEKTYTGLHQLLLEAVLKDVGVSDAQQSCGDLMADQSQVDVSADWAQDSMRQPGLTRATLSTTLLQVASVYAHLCSLQLTSETATGYLSQKLIQMKHEEAQRHVMGVARHRNPLEDLWDEGRPPAEPKQSQASTSALTQPVDSMRTDDGALEPTQSIDEHQPAGAKKSLLGKLGTQRMTYAATSSPKPLLLGGVSAKLKPQPKGQPQKSRSLLDSCRPPPDASLRNLDKQADLEHQPASLPPFSHAPRELGAVSLPNSPRVLMQPEPPVAMRASMEARPRRFPSSRQYRPTPDQSKEGGMLSMALESRGLNALWSGGGLSQLRRHVRQLRGFAEYNRQLAVSIHREQAQATAARAAASLAKVEPLGVEGTGKQSTFKSWRGRPGGDETGPPHRDSLWDDDDEYDQEAADGSAALELPGIIAGADRGDGTNRNRRSHGDVGGLKLPEISPMYKAHLSSKAGTTSNDPPSQYVNLLDTAQLPEQNHSPKRLEVIQRRRQRGKGQAHGRPGPMGPTRRRSSPTPGTPNFMDPAGAMACMGGVFEPFDKAKVIQQIDAQYKPALPRAKVDLGQLGTRTNHMQQGCDPDGCDCPGCMRRSRQWLGLKC